MNLPVEITKTSETNSGLTLPKSVNDAIMPIQMSDYLKGEVVNYELECDMCPTSISLTGHFNSKIALEVGKLDQLKPVDQKTGVIAALI